SNYINEIKNHPEKLIAFNLDGIFEIFMSLAPEQRTVLSATLKELIRSFDEKDRKKLNMIIPESAKKEIGI
ncbi:MAG: hypothetical protein P4K92_03000, partial [Candidatus Nitrosotalea sp.]|nr:hypothetical protein [Candidatus Nitrosotalea sp.]